MTFRRKQSEKGRSKEDRRNNIGAHPFLTFPKKDGLDNLTRLT